MISGRGLLFWGHPVYQAIQFQGCRAKLKQQTETSIIAMRFSFLFGSWSSQNHTICRSTYIPQSLKLPLQINSQKDIKWCGIWSAKYHSEF